MLTAEQQLVRSQGIGASEIAAVVGVNPWKTPFDVFLDKMGQVERTETDRTRMGHRMEPVIADEFASRANRVLELCDTLVHPRFSWAVATPDRRVVGARELVECKWVGPRLASHWGTDDDGVPEYVLTQCQWQLEVADADVCFVAALVGEEFRVYQVTRDTELAGLLLEQAERFWTDHVLTKTPPEITASPAARRYLESKYAKAGEAVLDPTPEADRLVHDYLEASRLEREAVAAKELAANGLRALIGDARGVQSST